MHLTADLHIHSHYSRATSSDLTFEHLARWAQLKGVHIVGTGDIAHPGWLAEMHEKLEPAEEGLYRLKPDIASAVQQKTPPACQGEVRFLLAGEISNIYKRDGRVRKVHNVIFAPSLQAVARLQVALERIGNIRSDGRPILGLDSRDLLETILEIDPRCHLIPAHIWTPWFSLLGSMSGFDSVEACFADLTPHIFALETGLSSDPPMNWRVSGLDRYTLVSNSDAHSPQKLGREATLFDIEPGYDTLFAALRTGDPARFLGTVEFFPEEGKYHLDGHRKCGVCWEPAATLAHDGQCSVCGKPVTVGVLHWVEQLSDRLAGALPARTAPFHSLVPLPEILSELNGVGSGSKRVQEAYQMLLGRLGPELAILREIPLDAVAAAGGDRLAAGIGRMRQGDVTTEGGYDGDYGVIRLFDRYEHEHAPQMALFGEPKVQTLGKPEKAAGALVQVHAVTAAPSPSPTIPLPATLHPQPVTLLSPAQQAAVHCADQNLVIVAGPGTGKTHTVTRRIAYLIQERGVSPESVLAVTFTNKAAEEMDARLRVLVGEPIAGRITIRTFHALGAALLREHGDRLGLHADFALCTGDERLAVLKASLPDHSRRTAERCLEIIAAAKNAMVLPSGLPATLSGSGESGMDAVYQVYETALRRQNLLDYDDLLLLAVRLLEDYPDVLAAVQRRYRWLTVDEYQDINAVQHRILRLLAAAGANVCAIGDPDQAIYGFRGADHRYFFSFEQDFPQALRLELDQNYRSTQAILDAAQQVIARNPDRLALNIIATLRDQVKLDVYTALTDKAEAEYVVHQVEQMVGGTSYFSLDSGRVDGDQPGERSFGDFAVLYRLNAQSRELVEAFERSGIPYQTAGQAPIYSHPDTASVLAGLWLLHTPGSRVHLAALLEAIRLDLGAEMMDQLVEAVTKAGSVTAGCQTTLLAHPSHPPAARLAAFATAWRSFEQARGATPVVELAGRMAAFLQTQTGAKPGAGAAERLRQLQQAATVFEDRLEAFLDATAIQTETDAYDRRAGRVALMTLHAAKGLEFPVVFITGCEDGLLPYLPEGRQVDVAEERRLFYVGMTRARRKLVLTHARSRFLFGRQVERSVSPFVEDIAAGLKELQRAATGARPAGPDAVQLSLF